MPRRDGTGPIGQGSLTGIGLGSWETGAFKKAAGAAGLGLGLRMGLGCRKGLKRNVRRRFALMDRFDSKEELRSQKKLLEARLREINKKLED
ncbi:DUF5320 domain-containing protein [Alkalibacter saccharofermentans]|uniref:DUF5320 domain-containing protein n=1 Tax=Alkalibacter saccharofermentans DSM 14828 TaxID=1120975 RepID=A0A1M4WJK1_9FIRM|nr:DUF5320 domain-containing protein [Alkalibacter saccharofermentans]SHE81461.1 hypothetical protein SAMN02746064_01262 [Alkalibacter saccharofermentans DSM 14828]